ncbi:hypothetical protein CR513_32129, partial [Mucuna pruriens]
FIVSFDIYSCIVKQTDDTTFLIVKRNNNIYKINLENLNRQNFPKKMKDYFDIKNIDILENTSSLQDMPKRKINQNAFQIIKNIISTSRFLELLFMNLFIPKRMLGHGGKKYGFIKFGDYSKYISIIFKPQT